MIHGADKQVRLLQPSDPDKKDPVSAIFAFK